jgi:hypothetical protein
MNCLAPSEEIELLVSYNTICERQRHALRLFAGRGKRFSAEELSLGSGVQVKRIYAALRPVCADDYRLLRHEELASITKFLTGEGLGAAFVSALLEPCSLGAFDLCDQQPLPRVFDEACKSPAKLTKEEHVRKAIEHLSAAEAME